MKESGVASAATAAPALDVFKRAVGQGLGDQDFSAVVKWLAKG